MMSAWISPKILSPRPRGSARAASSSSPAPPPQTPTRTTPIRRTPTPFSKIVRLLATESKSTAGSWTYAAPPRRHLSSLLRTATPPRPWSLWQSTILTAFCRTRWSARRAWSSWPCCASTSPPPSSRESAISSHLYLLLSPA